MKPPAAAHVQQTTREQLDELLALAKPTFPAPQYQLLEGVLATFVPARVRQFAPPNRPYFQQKQGLGIRF